MWPQEEKRIPQTKDSSIEECKWPISVGDAFNYSYLDEEGWEKLRTISRDRGIENKIVTETCQYEETVERIRQNVLETLEKMYIYPYPLGKHERAGRFMSLSPDRRDYYMSLFTACELTPWGWNNEKTDD